MVSNTPPDGTAFSFMFDPLPASVQPYTQSKSLMDGFGAKFVCKENSSALLCWCSKNVQLYASIAPNAFNTAAPFPAVPGEINFELCPKQLWSLKTFPPVEYDL